MNLQTGTWELLEAQRHEPAPLDAIRAFVDLHDSVVLPSPVLRSVSRYASTAPIRPTRPNLR